MNVRPIVRPGPEYLPAGMAPGGMVVRVYDVPSQVLLLERRLSSIAECQALAEGDAEFVGVLTSTVCLVAWDGDTGRRVPRAAWVA